MKEYLPVRSKHDFVRRYAAGEFGNAAPTWETFDEYLKSGYWEKVHIRNRVAGGRTWYNVTAEEFSLKWNEALVSGLNRQDLYISAMAPEHRKVFQGEVVQGVNGLRLYYNRQPLPMREGFEKEKKWADGVVSAMLLDQFLCPNSREWLCVLLDRYPGHVVEFSTYEIEWGTVPGYNTVFWEVRSY